MSTMLRLTIWLSALSLSILSPVRADSLPLDKIHLPAGFRIELFARVPRAREMTLGEHTLFVGSNGDAVYAIPLEGAEPAGQPKAVANGLRQPVGVAYGSGALYVSAVSRILRLPDIETRLDNPPVPQTVRDDFPTDGHHGWKFIAFGPDGWLYVPVGAPCNICEPDPQRYANLQRISVDGKKREVVATGIRNTVGFDWAPPGGTARPGSLWFTDNGRDMLGDDLPPDELNRVDKPGQHFGYPYCHGGYLADPEFGGRRLCGDFTPPAQRLGPHVASLGMRFYTGNQFPAEYRNQIFIAEHGSWNRSQKIGYRVTLVKLDGQGNAVSYTPFADGWLDRGEVWGRPADVLVHKDGSLLVSDDQAGAIYRIRYVGK